MWIERKAALPIREQPDDVWRQLLAIAERATPETKRKFLNAIAKLRDDLDVEQIGQALDRGDINGVIDAVPWDDLRDALEQLEIALDEVRAKSFTVSRGAALPHLDASQLAIHLGNRAELAIDFRHVSPFVLDAIRARAAARVTGIVEETRAAIKALIEEGYATGQHARKLLPALQETIGLTARQERAVAKYARALTNDDVPEGRRIRMVARYRKKLLTYRADLIARTETMQAMNDGQRATWATLVERGLLDVNHTEREWVAIIPTDGRTCPICTALDGVRAPLGGDYAGEGAGGPPQHPDCRCTEKLVTKAP